MNFAVEHHRVFETGNLAVEPQMHTANRPMLMALNLPGQLLRAFLGGQMRQ